MSNQAGQAMIVVERGAFTGRLVELHDARVTIGRSSKNDLSLKGAPGVSRVHCQVLYDGGRYYISDLGSRNGTLVNGIEIQGSYPLADGDLIEISDEAMRFSQPGGPSPDALADRETFVMDPAGRAPVNREAPLGEAPKPGSFRLDMEFNDDLTPMYVPPAQVPTGPGVPPPIEPAPDDPLPVLDLQDALRQRTLTNASAILRDASMEARRKSSIMFIVGGLVGLVIMLGALVAWDAFLNDGLFRSDVEAWLLPDDEAGAEPPPAEPKAPTPKAPAPEPESAAPDAVAPPTTTSPPPDPPAPKSPPPTPPPPTTTAPEKPPPAAQTPPGDGAAATRVNASRGGRITRVHVKPGQTVAAGDRLLFVDATPGRVRKKLAALEQEERALKKYAAKGRAQAKKDLTIVRAELKQYRGKIKQFSVRAPHAGTVLTVHVRRGQNLSKGKPVVDIAPP